MSKGHIDTCQNGVLEGWATLGSSTDQAAVVRIYIDGENVGTVVADGFRDDLEASQVRGGYAYFRFSIPPRFGDGQTHHVVAEVLQTNEELFGSPFRFEYDARGAGSHGFGFYKELVFTETELDDDLSRFLQKVRAARKVVVFCGYDQTSRTKGYVHCLVSAWSNLGFPVLHVHAPALKTDGPEGVGSPADLIIQKANVGYDFGSWFAGLAVLGQTLSQLDEMILANDSVFGPIFDFTQFLTRARTSGADLFGILDSYEHGYHLQSYLLWFSRNAVASGMLLDLCEGYSITNDKGLIVQSGEIGLTRAANDAGLATSVMVSFEEVREAWLLNFERYVADVVALEGAPLPGQVSTRQTEARLETLFRLRADVLSGMAINPSHYFWRPLIETLRFPLIKKDLVLRNPVGIPDWHLIRRVLKASSEYNVLLMEEVYRSGKHLILV